MFVWWLLIVNHGAFESLELTKVLVASAARSASARGHVRVSRAYVCIAAPKALWALLADSTVIGIKMM